MKAIYKAVRNILYPQAYPAIANAGFAEGRHWFAMQYGYSPALCQELMDFEQGNRGHRHLLNADSLHAESNDLVIPGDARRAAKVRHTVKASMYWLFRRVIDLDTLPLGNDFQFLLAAPDEQGYFQSFVHDELTKMCEKQLQPLLPRGVYVARTRVESGAAPVLHVRVELHPTGLVAKRAIQLAATSATSLGEARAFLRDSARRIQEALVADMAKWPELTPQESDAVAEEKAKGVGFNMHAPLLHPLPLAPMPCDIENIAREVANNSLDLGISPRADQASELPTSDEVDAGMDAHRVLVERLQRHMKDFLSMYSPDVQKTIAENWEQFHPDIING